MLTIAIIICIFASASAFPHYGDFSKNFSAIILQSEIKIAQKDATCQPKMLEYLDALGKMEMWAIQMFDATSKLQSGITNGNLMDLGDFDVCLSVNHEGASGSIKGKHCVGYMSLIFSTKSNKWENLMANTRRIQNYPKSQSETAAAVLTSGWSMCIPDSCLAAEAAVYFNSFLQSLNLPLSIYATEDSCQTMETISRPLDTLAIVATVFFSIILFLMVEQTLYDLYLHYKGSKPYHPSFIAFSVLTNGKKLFATGRNEGQLGCLDGIKAISMMWIVFGHRYTIISLGIVTNAQDILEWLDSWPSMFIANATLGVDTFFLVGGLLVSYVFLKATAKSTKLFFNVPKFYLHRYLRLTPAMAAMVLFNVGIFPYFGSGPQYSTMNALIVEPCKKWWWSTLLYVQNYVNTEEMCVGQTWYLNVDTQLFFFSPLVLIPLKKYPKVALSIAGAGIGFSLGWSLYVARHYGMYALTTNLDVDNTNYLLYYYNSSLTRATPWILGLILGYFIHQIQKKQITFNPPKLMTHILWPVSLAIMLTCVFAGHDTLRGVDTDPWANAFHIMLVRPVWAICLSWIILACLFGSGGFVNDFLSLPIFQVLSRLTYSVFLTHLLVMPLMAATRRINLHFSDYEMMYMFWGDYFIAHATGILWCLAFESPVMVLEKLIFGRKTKKVEEVKKPEA